MQLVKTALVALAGVGLFCGSAFAGDEDGDQAKRILDKVEKKLEQEREKVRDTVEKILDEEMRDEKTEKKVEKKTEKKADQKPYLGVFLNESEGGPAVAEIMEGSPAEKAGLQSGDVILKVNGKDVGATPDVIGAVAEHKVGDKLKLEVLRDKENVTITVTLAPRPEELAANFTPPNDEGGDEEADEDEEKEEGKPGPGPDELRKRIRKFMDRMREGRGDEKGEADEGDEKEEPKEAKKPKKGAKKLLDEAMEDDEDQPKKQPKKEPKKQPKKEPEGDEEGADEDSENPPDMGNFEELARRFMEELMQPRERGEGDEDAPGADDPMGRVMEWFQSEEGQKMMEELQPMIEQLMQDENIQKMLEDLMQGQGMQPPDSDEDEEEGEDLTQPEREQPKQPARGGQAYLGVSPGELSDDLRDQLEIKNGVVINDVVEDGPGAKAGLKKNDVILSIDGEEIAGVEDVRGALTGKKPGDEVEIVVLRKGKKKTITVELGKKGASLPQDNTREQAAGRAMEQLQQALQLDPSVEEAMKDFRGSIERRVQGRGENVKKAVEDFRLAIEKARGTAEDQKNGQDPAAWMKQMAEFAKVFAKDKELFWNVTDKDGKVLWKQRLEPDKMLDLAARLGANEAQKAAQSIQGTKVTEWTCDEDCCKDKRTKGEETSASQHSRRELPQWRKEIRERIQGVLGGKKTGEGKDEGCEDGQ